jgi:hypothetical protein
MENNKIYFSGSIYGVKHKDTNFSWELVQYMKNLGFNVLSEHVAARDKKEMSELFHKNTGVDQSDIRKRYFAAYEWDMKWVDECNYLIAVVDGPSHGVGMEIMRAILKPERGLNETKILCLVNENNVDNLSGMIQGVPRDKYSNFQVVRYTDLGSAKEIVNKFLIND